MIAAVSRAPRRAPRWAGLALSALLVLFLTVLPGLPGGVPPAGAAVPAHTVSFGGWVVGGFASSTGELVYCIEPGAMEPSGAQQSATVTDTLPGYTSNSFDPTGWNGTVTSGPLSGEAVRQMNWMLSVYGQNPDPDTAAATQLALWIVRGDPGLAHWLDHHLGWARSHGGAWHVDRALQMVEEARANAVGAPSAVPSAQLEIVLDDVPGTGFVRYPAGTTRLRIAGAVFEDGRPVFEIAGGEAGAVAWRTDLHEPEWRRLTPVSVSGEWQREVSGWPAQLRLHAPAERYQQALGSTAGPVETVVRADLPPVEAQIDAQFAPVLETRSETRFVRRGDGAFADRVTLGVVPGARPWAERSGTAGAEYAPVTAEGVLYGPYAQPQQPSQSPPPGAPVAARARLVADRGPGEYRVAAEQRPRESGYYYWVWRIREDEQPDVMREAGLMPAGYAFQDAFGLVDEGHVVPSTVRWSTELAERELPLDGLVLRDRVRASLHGGAWLQDAEGERIPAVLRLTVYRSDERPERSTAPPAAAEEIAQERVTVAGPDETVEAPPIRLPFETRGWVTVRSCLLAEDQDERAEHIEEWCDDYGVPEETAQILLPVVRTEARPAARIGETIHDTAFVDGAVPAGASLGFTLYLRPEAGALKYDERWEPRTDELGAALRWTEAELAAMSEEERCLAQPVAHTARIDVAETGSLRSPGVLTRSEGVGYWVEDLAMPHPDTGEPAELHRGRCGLENERTVIGEAPVLPGTGAPGQPIWLVAVPLAGISLLAAAMLRRRGRGRSASSLRDPQAFCSPRRRFS